MFTRLSDFQKASISNGPVRPLLSAVLKAAVPAFEAGFAYTAAHCSGELTVTLHYQGAEVGSSAPATLENYSDTTARLLAGLLGIQLAELDHHSGPEQQVKVTDAEAAPAASTEAVEAEPAPAADVAEDEEEFDNLEPEDVTRPLTDSEKATAVEMVKVLPVDQRKTFTKTFREVFAVPADSKQIVPFITELRHLQFIDRFTVEASGGVAA
jgi:hypothetical protein